MKKVKCNNESEMEKEMTEVQFWLPEGTIVGQRYRIEHVLGIGGYGITYKGLDTRLEQVVAVKEYYPSFWVSRFADRDKFVHCRANDLEAYDKGMDRFLEEAKTLAALSYVPEVVRVTDFFEENNTAYLVMEFLDGQNLKQMADGFGGRIPAEVLIPVLEPLVKAFTKIHEKGLIHRDISPDNIMMLEDGTTRLIDFGNARDTTNNKSMTLAMKQGFAAPEQYKSRGQGTFTDVYGLCATMYYCLTGKLPPQAMERLTGTPFYTPTELGVSIDAKWEKAIMDGLDLFVQKRIQTMDELWQRLYGTSELYGEEEQAKMPACDFEQVKSNAGNSKSAKHHIESSHSTDGDVGNSQNVEMAEAYEPTRILAEKTVEQVDDEFESKLNSSLDKIRSICIQIYRKLKEK